jgi:ABC-type antimicrobial peptide transport system permease subunit
VSVEVVALALGTALLVGFASATIPMLRLRRLTVAEALTER